MFNNMNIVTIDLHMNSMNIISKESGKHTEKNVYLPNSVLNHEDILDAVHLKYLIKKHIFPGKKDIYLVYSNRDLIIRNIDVSSVSNEDIDGYLQYQIQDLIPINTSEKIIRISKNVGNINIFCQSKNLIDKLYDVFVDIDHTKLFMEPNINNLLQNIKKLGILNEIECAIILNFFSVELVLIGNDKIKYYKYYKIQSNFDDEEKENLYRKLHSRSLFDYLSLIEKDDLVMEYLYEVTDIFKEIKGLKKNENTNRINTLLLGETLDIPDYIKYIESLLGIERYDLSKYNSYHLDSMAYKYLHIVKLEDFYE